MNSGTNNSVHRTGDWIWNRSGFVGPHSTEHMKLAHKEWTPHTEGNPSRNWPACTRYRRARANDQCTFTAGCEWAKPDLPVALRAVGVLLRAPAGCPSRGTHMVAHLTCAEHGETRLTVSVRETRTVRACMNPAASNKAAVKPMPACVSRDFRLAAVG